MDPPPLHKFNPGNSGMANGLSLAIYTDVSGCGYQLSNMNAAPAWRQALQFSSL